MVHGGGLDEASSEGSEGGDGSESEKGDDPAVEEMLRVVRMQESARRSASGALGSRSGSRSVSSYTGSVDVGNIAVVGGVEVVAE